MNTLQCELPDITLTKPKGLDSRLFFKVYNGPNAIAFAQLGSRTVNDYSGVRSGFSEFGEKAPGVNYCLKNIEVSQSYRNRGIGTALLEEVISFCKDERISTLYGEAKGEIEALRRWYEEKGFELDDIDNIQLSFAA
jgi:GNAT superfamily N-acetyltransferase